MGRLQDEREYEAVMAAVRDALDRGETRINHLASARMSLAAFSEVRPSMVGQMLLDNGESGPFKEIEGDFQEEIAAIREAIAKYRGGQRKEDPAQRMMESLNMSADAFAIWDLAGVPFRHYRGYVLQISSPQDVMGSPHIAPLGTVDAFLALVADRLGRLEARLAKRSRWNPFAR